MKKQLLVLATVVTFSGIGFGQDQTINGNLIVDDVDESHSNIRLGHELNDRVIVDNNSNKPYGGGYFFRVHDNTVSHKYRDVMTLTEIGNVGIGTIKPTTLLDIKKVVKDGDIVTIGLDGVNPKRITLGTKSYGGNISLFDAGSREMIRFDSSPGHSYINNGNVGIGTTNPNAKLEVGVSHAHNQSEEMRIGSYWQGKFIGIGFGYDLNNVGTPFKYIKESYGENTYKTMYFRTGNVGIGTTSPDEKLTVKGKIHAEEVRVDLSVPADYVFEKYYTGKSELKADYVMPTLEEVEAFTKANNHLPNIPSAQEIQAEGLHLKQMTNLLLQKVEELTLYTIEQQKEIKALKAKVTQLEKE